MFKFYSRLDLIDRKVLGNPKAMFNNATINTDTIESLDFRYLIYDIDGSAIYNRKIFANRYRELLSTRDYPNGIKTLANHMYISNLQRSGEDSPWKDYMVDLSYCGRNGVHLLLTSDYMQKYDNVPLFTQWACWKLIDASIPIEYNGQICTVADAGDDMIYRDRWGEEYHSKF
jgi:hypothetical protein